jgi:hypothetical protein
MAAKAKRPQKHLNHRGVRTGTEALDFEERKEPVLGGSAVLHVERFHDGLLDVFAAAHHARGGAAELNEVLA